MAGNRLVVIAADPFYKYYAKGEIKARYWNSCGLFDEVHITERVDFMRQVPNVEIAEHYQKADIFAMATHYEGFCIPVLEAMAAGLPIVASATGQIPEVLGDTGLLVENNATAFSNALANLQNDVQWREVLGAAARQRAYTINGLQMEDRETNLYRVLMDRHRTSSI